MTIFIEDGIETKNTITGNLVANTRQSFALLNVDQTPASYWIVNPDNYVERNIAAGSTHYDFWFFPEPAVRGASADAGASETCRQGVPLLHFADNEAHNNGRYGLRIFTSKGLGGFCKAPRAAPTWPRTTPSSTRPSTGSFRGATTRMASPSARARTCSSSTRRRRQLRRGIEMLGADGVVVGLSSDTKMRGAWGKNLIDGALFVGHPLDCPTCDHSFLPYSPASGGRDHRRQRLAAHRRAPRPRDARLVRPHRPELDVDQLRPRGDGGRRRLCRRCRRTARARLSQRGRDETRFKGVTWLQSNFRVRWRWAVEALFVDVDGSFTEGLAGASVLDDTLTADPRAYPECWQDPRYGGTVCPPGCTLCRSASSSPTRCSSTRRCAPPASRATTSTCPPPKERRAT